MNKNLTMTHILSLAALIAMPLSAQNLKLNGVANNNRHDDGEQMTSQYVGWNSELQKPIFVVENGLYTMTWDGKGLTSPVKEPEVNIEDFYSNGAYTDNTKALWAANFNLMYGNSGAAYVNGKIVTVMSRDEQSTTDEELFAVRKWDAKTGQLLSTETKPKSALLESAGMSYNPVDGKVYGLFYITEADLAETITADPEYFVDDDDADAGREGLDAGYAICTIDLATMKVTPVTPGLYYYNFVTFAINSEGRAFALTSGGAAGYEGPDGRMYNIDGKLTGAQLCEFDLTTGLMLTKPQAGVDSETGEPYITYVNIYDEGTGYCSQYRRQSACFSKSNPTKMYWNGYVNSGKGINDNGSWTSLPDREWRTNGKYDTALYEVDIETGRATRLATIADRWTFAALWVDGDDPSDGTDFDPFFHDTQEPTEGAWIALQSADGGSIWQPVEKGQQYRYFIQVSEGWAIHSVSFNGTELTVDDEGMVTTPAVSADRNRLIVVYEQTGVDAVEAPAAAPAADIRVVASDRGLHITGASVGDPIQVYAADGRQLSAATVSASTTDVPLAPGQLYIARIGQKTVKVRL